MSFSKQYRLWTPFLDLSVNWYDAIRLNTSVSQIFSKYLLCLENAFSNLNATNIKTLIFLFAVLLELLELF